MTNSVDPDRTAPIGAVRSGSTLFATTLKFFSNVRQFVAADDLADVIFRMYFFLGVLRVKAALPVTFDLLISEIKFLLFKNTVKKIPKFR